MESKQYPVLMTVEQCSEYLGGVAVATLYGWAHKKKIPSQKIGGLLRFPRPAIDAWLESQHRPATASLSRFQAARLRVRSLKTERTAIPEDLQKGA